MAKINTFKQKQNKEKLVREINPFFKECPIRKKNVLIVAKNVISIYIAESQTIRGVKNEK